MGDVFSKIRSLAVSHVEAESELRTSLLAFATRLVESTSGADVSVSSDNTTFEEDGSGDAVYGHLFYSRGTVAVAYRHSEEDTMQYLHQEDLDEPTFHIKKLEDCSEKWLRAISQPRVIDSLLQKMVAELEAQHTSVSASIRNIGQTLNVPVRNAEDALEAAARELGYDDVISEWQSAQAAVYRDPRDAITRASSLVETVCKHVLTARGVQFPSDLTIQGLLKSVLKVLGWSPESQANEDLRKTAGGIMTVIFSLGAWRTHEGTAHGRAPGDRMPTHVEARLAVNLAGVASTFLMEAANRSRDGSPLGS
ncbi:MAG TPA: abortive infection family protein [Vicinamibacterales bacterium]|nr:abortive infection family protein [Vicinamibacterales bacterium]